MSKELRIEDCEIEFGAETVLTIEDYKKMIGGFFVVDAGYDFPLKVIVDRHGLLCGPDEWMLVKGYKEIEDIRYFAKDGKEI